MVGLLEIGDLISSLSLSVEFLSNHNPFLNQATGKEASRRP